MKTIKLTDNQIATCKDLLHDKITGINIIKHHEVMYLREAENHQEKANIKVCKKKISELKKQSKELKIILENLINPLA